MSTSTSTITDEDVAQARREAHEAVAEHDGARAELLTREYSESGHRALAGLAFRSEHLAERAGLLAERHAAQVEAARARAEALTANAAAIKTTAKTLAAAQGRLVAARAAAVGALQDLLRSADAYAGVAAEAGRELRGRGLPLIDHTDATGVTAANEVKIDGTWFIAPDRLVVTCHAVAAVMLAEGADGYAVRHPLAHADALLDSLPRPEATRPPAVGHVGAYLPAPRGLAYVRDERSGKTVATGDGR
jgi:hypothetical protein